MIHIYFFPYIPDYITKIAMDTIGLYINANNPEKWLFLGKKENTHNDSECRKNI